MNMRKNLIFLGLCFVIFLSCSQKNTDQSVRRVTLDIEPVDIRPNQERLLEAWTYNQSVPGMTLIGRVGETMIIEGVNNLDKTTTIHWHGLSPIPVSEDGPFKPIAPGEKFRFEFKLHHPGTYWYHSHTRPVVEQVNRGLYAPFIIKAPEDELYDGDHIIMLSDMMLGSDKKWQPGLGIGTMERIGNTIAVNGYIDEAVQPLSLKPGEIHKLRFIGAGTAAYFRVSSPWPLHITHTDARPVEEPYLTQEFIVGPGERYDAELLVDSETSASLNLEIVDSVTAPIFSYGVFSEIPLIISGEKQSGRNYIFQGVQKPDYTEWLAKEPDHILYLTSSASGGDHSAMAHHHGGHGQTSENNTNNAVTWYINGQVFPHVPPILAKKNVPMKIRFVNNDEHPMDHPMHLHGASFRVLAVNGQPPAQGGLLDKDVINVPKNGGQVDILIELPEPGTWMLHCHILDHEDGGMMMHVETQA